MNLEKMCETIISSIIGFVFVGFLFYSLFIGIIGAVIFSLGYLQFCKEDEQFKEKLEKEREKEKLENEIFLKKIRCQERKERKDHRKWLKELKELHPH